MNLRVVFFRLACLAGLLGTCPMAQAQQPAPPAATDVLLLTTGQEISGRVLTITPTELTYLPAAPTPPDTLRLPVASVLLVRYANGTREVLAALASIATDDPTPPALRGLSTPQRRQLGQQDALRYYRASGPYWGALGSTLYLGPLLGLAPTAAISSQWVRDYNLKAPTPLLLQDDSYAQGYRQQANRTKRRRAWSGYGIGTAVYVVLLAALVAGGH